MNRLNGRHASHGMMTNMASMGSLGSMGGGGGGIISMGPMATLAANPPDRDGDFEPSCLVRTPSGNVYIPTDISKNSQLDYKSNSSCSSPSKGENLKNSERCSLPYGPAVPVLPVRNNLRRPNSSHFPQPRLHFRKGIAARCSWKCAAISFIMLSVVLTAAVTYMLAANLLNWSYQSSKSCTVHVGEGADPFPKSSTETEQNRSTSNRPRTSNSPEGKDDPPHLRMRRDASYQHDPVEAHSTTPYANLHDNGVMTVHDITSENYSAEGVELTTEPGSVPYLVGVHGLGIPAVPTSPQDLVGVTLVPDPNPADGFEHVEDFSDPPPFILEETDAILPQLDSSSALNFNAANNADNTLLPNLDEITTSEPDTNKSTESNPYIASDEKLMNDATPNSPDTPDNAVKTEEAVKEESDTSFVQSDAIQGDQPVYIYGTEMVEIVHLKKGVTNNEDRSKDAVSDEEKTPEYKLSSSDHSEEDKKKTLVHRNLSSMGPSSTSPPLITQNLAEVLTKEVLTNAVSTNSVHGENAATSLTAHHSKRVLVNVTITTDNDAIETAHSSQAHHSQVYVLSVAVPTNDDTQEPLNEIDISPPEQKVASVLLGVGTNHPSPTSVSTEATTSEPETVPANHTEWGGKCVCTCPTVDELKKRMSVSVKGGNSVESVVESSTGDGVTVTDPTYLMYDTSSEDAGDVTDMPENDSQLSGDSLESSLIPTSVPELDVDSSLLTTSPVALQCPEVPIPEILILEGARTFPARTFPPDGTTFAQVKFGQRLSREIPPYSYWNMQFYQSQAAFVSFDWNVPRGASVGVYARKNALPTHTHYDFMEVLSGLKPRTSRATHLTVKNEGTHYMEPGHWFVSLYNDDGDPHEISFVATVSEDMTTNCPNGCSGKGECLTGHCQCFAGFGGEDCSESVCPVLCSQRGEYINGECHCNPGWKGKECSLRHDECEIPDCNGHGHCTNGKCTCVRGYKGRFCNQVDCPHPNCTGHGYCSPEGVCICKKGWKGPDCSLTDNEALQCLPNCSGHGTFDIDTQTCSCERMWTGEDCSKELCDKDCGGHGHCVSDACACDPGWSGEYCNLMECDQRCNEHGQCKNGTCLCVTGWNGKHCTLEGCPKACSGHGQCNVTLDGLWVCQCYDDWDGKDCSVALEQNCGDGRDNDKDGLIDCQDPECCGSAVCNNSQLCVSSPKPTNILLRKQPPAITASFFERMKFLIEEGSLQRYAKQDALNESRSAVVRGRVITALGKGMMGVRVGTGNINDGYTITREDGWFDLLLNGGGAITLKFGRAPFPAVHYIVNVPWNEVVVIDAVVMGIGDERGASSIPPSQPCTAHDYDHMKPVILATWKHSFQGSCPDKSAILVESQAVQESIQIPGTGLNLVYHSSRATGYLSTIQLQLTPETIQPSLKLVHLRITIEGILFEKIFEADPVIKYTYAWNRLNVYRQRVYGVTTAVVKVGYEYWNCSSVIWDVQTTKLSGHDMGISEVGGWNLDIHHRYNFHEGILQKGDGSNLYLKHKPRIIQTALGDGHQRPVECDDCEGPAGAKQRLLAPVALAATPDGTLFVGDFNLVRRILVDGTVRTVVRLNATRVSYRYHLAMSPLDNTLFISDPEAHQIIKVRDIDDYSDPDHNWEPAVGSGERCLPGDEAHCGDGALARDAKLAYPKGMAVSADGILYFADGTNIRMVDRDGIVNTIIGTHMHKSHWKSVPCEGTLKQDEVHLRWPTDLAINPLDNSLHIIDDHIILKLTSDSRIKVEAGRPIVCMGLPSTHDAELATHATLVMPQAIAFGPAGDLFVAESDSQRINRVRVIDTNGRIKHFAGAESKCNCLDRGCDCFEEDHYLAATAKFNTISSIAVTPDGILHIGDQANYRIRSVTSSIPEASAIREYEIHQPDTQEVYVFNRFGQHVATRNLLTGETLFLFSYNVNTSTGKLSTVTDAQANKVFLLRDYSYQVNSIENTKGQKCRVRISRLQLLSEFSTPDNYNVTLNYHGPDGLLKSKLDSTGRSYVYNYDEFGRLTSAVTPTGRIVSLEFDLSTKGAMVRVKQDGRRPESMLIKGSSVVTKLGEAKQRTILLADGSVSSILPWGHEISTDTVPYTLLSEVDPVLGESYPIPAKQRTEIGGDLANSFEWKYFRGQSSKTKSGKSINVGRKLRVNGETILVLEYDRESNTVGAFIDDHHEILNVTYDRTARPIKWSPRNGIFADVELEYDRFSRLTSWRWGELSETYGFDRAGRLFEIRYADGSSLQYAFKDMFSSLPLKVTTPRGSDYLLQYDEAGALQSLTTPRGHIHAFSLQTSLGFFKYQYYSPVGRHPFEILYNDDGQILAKVYPHQSGRVSYVYDQTGKLDTVLAGTSSIHYTYQENSNMLKYIDNIEPHLEMKHEFKYHAGALKSEKLLFGSNSGLSNTHYRFQYDGNARISTIEVDINSKQLPGLRLKYNQNLGVLESINDLRVYRNSFNRSVMQDSAKQFFTVTEIDSHGRVKNILINIKSFDVFRLELEYDKKSRIKTQQLQIGRTSSMDRISYNADGHVMEVVGSGSNINDWKFVYDENGNVIGTIEQGQKTSLGYDTGDRVVQVGDVEFCSYDQRGFVIRRGEQKYQYSPRGHLTHAFERDKFSAWYSYDDRGRMVSWKDAQENVTQLLYAYPHTPELVSHVHSPKTGRTFRLMYNDREMLVAVETSEQRFYVATDQNGSPLAFFDTNGNIIKEIRRTAFGKVTMDSNPDFYLPVDFHGGILDPHTGLVYISGRLYDPVVGQWMTPAWEQLASQLRSPTDVFIYRFYNNDPINPPERQVNYMTDLPSWLNLFGYDINKMLGSAYTNQMVYRPAATISGTQLAPELRVMSGLQCIVEKVTNRFSDLSFVPEPLLKMEGHTRNLLPRVAYRRAVFGEGVLISRGPGGRALVSVVDGVNSVVQDVVTSVFNNSHFLEVHFSLHDQDVFYFVKDNPLKIRDDMDELKRLGAMFNVSTHETVDHGSSATKELRLHNPDAAVFIRYGTEPDVERQRILKHAHKRAVEQAWKLEKAVVAAGFGGRNEWTPEERDELLANGIVGGWEGGELHTLHRYPQLADDPGNVTFRRDANRKRRKSGSGRRRRNRHET